VDLNKTNDKFVEGKLYRAPWTNNPIFCEHSSYEHVTSKANVFIFLGKNKSENSQYLFYAISECKIVTIDTVWAVRNIVEMK
jgi:hypothetical protein